MPQRRFFGRHTDLKLRTVADYAAFYTTALSQTKLRLKYLDAFAGTGELPISDDQLPSLLGVLDISTIADGSARRALSIARPFDKYYFSDSSKQKTRELAAAIREFPALAKKITIWDVDAAEAIETFCAQLTDFERALVFLDPFGSQVSWSSLERLAATQKVDLWYLFPAGLSVVRQIRNDGRVLENAEASLGRLFPDDEWKEVCIRTTIETGLFEDRVMSRKIATADEVTRHMISKMSVIFRGGVADAWLPLGRNGVHKFSLIFACANPSSAAHNLAKRVAKEIMTRR